MIQRTRSGSSRRGLALAAATAAAGVALSATPALAADPFVTSGRQAWLPRVMPAGLPAPTGPVPPIAIVETWIDTKHPEMQGGWVNMRRYGPPPDESNTAAVIDWIAGVDHGTMVASVIGAPENGVGMQGVLPSTPVWLYGSSDLCRDVAAATRQAGQFE